MDVKQKLIDANELLNSIRDDYNINGTHFAMIRRHIEEAKAVDAVEVVRCKDCIGRSTWYNDAEYGCAVCGMSGMYPKSEDGYCSYGIRKDGGENG